MELSVLFSKYFSNCPKFVSVLPLKKGILVFGVFKNLLQNRFLLIISSKNSGLYCWASLIESLHSIKYLAKKIKSLGFLDKGKPSVSKKEYVNFSSSLMAIL